MIDARSICRGVVEGVIPFPLLVDRHVRVDDGDRLLLDCRGCGLRDGDGGERTEVRPAADRAFVRAFALLVNLFECFIKCDESAFIEFNNPRVCFAAHSFMKIFEEIVVHLFISFFVFVCAVP